MDEKDGPPADLRYLTRPKSRVAGEDGAAKVVSFLQSIYDSVAETLPDVKDDGVETYFEGCDPNAVDDYSTVAVPESTLKKARKYKSGLKLHQERRPCNSQLEVRFLPPGSMKEYYEQFMTVDDKVSFSLFWRTWRIEFEHLQFRGVSSHAQCATCLRHRVLMRELAPYIRARTRQATLFHQHLMAQYRDRMSYWSMRSSSRLRVLGCLVVIQDGMDQAKYCLPRSRLCLAKDLSNLNRPKLGVIGLLAHGLTMMFAVSNPDHPKDSSCMAEVLCHLLTRLVKKHKLNLRDTTVHVFADNTSRETKNSTTLRLLTALTQRGTLECFSF